MDLDAFLDQKAKKSSKRKAKTSGLSDRERLELGLDSFSGIGVISLQTDSAMEPTPAAATTASPEASGESKTSDANVSPAEKPDAEGPVNVSAFIAVKAISTSKKKAKTWDEMKQAQERKAAAAAAVAEPTEGEEEEAGASPASPASPAIEPEKPKKFVARGHSGATGTLDRQGNTVAFSTENLPTLEDAFSSEGKPKKGTVSASPDPTEEEPSNSSTGASSPISASVPGKYVPPTQRASGGGGAVAYKPPSSSSAGAYKPPTGATAGAYRPPSEKWSPAGQAETVSIKKEEATNASSPNAPGKYVPPTQRASGGAGAYKPPSGQSSAGAYRPPERKSFTCNEFASNGNSNNAITNATARDSAADPVSTSKYVPPSQRAAGGSSAGAYRPPGKRD